MLEYFSKYGHDYNNWMAAIENQITLLQQKEMRAAYDFQWKNGKAPRERPGLLTLQEILRRNGKERFACACRQPFNWEAFLEKKAAT